MNEHERARSAFLGKPLDPDTGLYFLGERPYSPTLRRFLAPDPVSPFDAGGINRYAYCSGDPINRVDPDGNSWLEWLIAGVTLALAVAGTAATFGTMGGVLGAAAAGSVTAAMSTPASVTLGLTAVVEVVSVAAEIGSMVALAKDDENLGRIFGLIGVAGAVTAGPGIVKGIAKAAGATAGSARRSGRFVGRHLRNALDDAAPGRTRAPIYGADQVPPERFRLDRRTGHLRLQGKWHRHSHPANRRARHLLVDTAIGGRKQIRTALRHVAHRRDQRGVYIYSGVHGTAEGSNWVNDVRVWPERHFFDIDLADAPSHSIVAGNRHVDVEDIAGVTQTDMAGRMQRSGYHVHAYCYSAADRFVVGQLGVPPYAVYRL